MPSLYFKDINYYIKIGRRKKKEWKTILKDVSGSIEEGDMVAILGSSGSGKTTLLNVLSGRITTGKLEGEVLYNGKKRVPYLFKKEIAYVEQDDLLFSALTVKETFSYSANLRLDSKDYPPEEKKCRVDTLINSLRLDKVKDSIVVGVKNRGISGGERKRVSIGVELLSDPHMIMMDEPTSGLDSSSAETFINLVRKITRENKKISIASIHQPSARVFNLFDKVILLSGGEIIYFGPVDKSIDYFSQAGFRIPEYENPADYFISLVTVDTESPETTEKSVERIETLKTHWKNYLQKNPENLVYNEQIPGESRSIQTTTNEDQVTYVSEDAGVVSRKGRAWSNSWGKEEYILLHRSWKRQLRDKSVITSFMASGITTMLLIGFTFFNPGVGFAQAQNKIGLIFLISVNMLFPIVMPILPILITERDIMLRERASRAYRVSTFMFSVILTMLPIVILSTLIMLTGIYFLAKFQYLAYKYFIFIGISITTILCSFGFALLVSAVSSKVEVAAIVSPLILSIFLIYGGNLVNSNTIPAVLGWLKYISYVYYTYSALMQNEFTGRTFECSSAANTACYPNGEAVLTAFGLTQVSIGLCAILNLVIAFVFFVSAYLAIRFKTKPRYIWI
ncbi:hypothetical protein BB559_005768 [Furculomyces boomerangus]|uniref:ABC transporter domain-containing protein n=1 Tax=Furculomyces boomerangus TaxID=61424 RepID=A0A2T9Y6P3_9FUNG|nr:hypothetical protein BB559_005768 [Furculomyces boomerangus]